MGPNLSFPSVRSLPGLQISRLQQAEAILAAVIMSATCLCDETSLSLTKRLHISRVPLRLGLGPIWRSEQPKVTGGQMPAGCPKGPALDIRFRGRAEGDLLELRPHAQVLPDDGHECNTHSLDQPPGQRRGETGAVEPTAQEVKEMDSDSEIQTLLPSPDEVQQAQGTVGKGQQRVVTGWCWPYRRFLGTIRMAAVVRSKQGSEKQGLSYQMLRELPGNIKSGSDSVGKTS